MFELVYLDPFQSDRRCIERDPSKVTYSKGGVSIAVTQQTSTFIPWQRVMSVSAPTKSLLSIHDLFTN